MYAYILTHRSLYEESWVLQMKIRGLEWHHCLILNQPFPSGRRRWL